MRNHPAEVVVAFFVRAAFVRAAERTPTAALTLTLE
jgi:hypothetical protein